MKSSFKFDSERSHFLIDPQLRSIFGTKNDPEFIQRCPNETAECFQEHRFAVGIQGQGVPNAS